MTFLMIFILAGLLLVGLGVFFTIFGIVKKMKAFIIIGGGMIGLCVLGAFALTYLITSM